MSQTLETWGKVMAGGAALKGGISGINKQFKKLSPEARAKKKQEKEEVKQKKETAKVEKEASKEYLREHGNLLQAMSDGLRSKSTLRKTEEAQAIAIKQHTDKMQKEVDDSKKRDIDDAHDEAVKAQIEGTHLQKEENKSKEKKLQKAMGGGDSSPSIAPPKSAMSTSATSQSITKKDTGQEPGGDESTPIHSEDAKVVKAIEGQGSLLGTLFAGISTLKQNMFLGEMVDQGREGLKLDAERAAREIKADRRALEDRRDAKAPKPGAPTLLKGEGGDEGGGFFDSMVSMIGPWVGKIALGLGGVTTAVVGLKTLSNKWFKTNFKTPAVAEIAKQAKVAPTAKEAKVAKQAKQAKVAKTAEKAPKAKVAKVAEKAPKAKVAKVAAVAEKAKVAKVAEKAPKAKVAEKAPKAKVAKVAEKAKGLSKEQVKRLSKIKQAKVAKVAKMAKMAKFDYAKLAKQMKVNAPVVKPTGLKVNKIPTTGGPPGGGAPTANAALKTKIKIPTGGGGPPGMGAARAVVPPPPTNAANVVKAGAQNMDKAKGVLRTTGRLLSKAAIPLTIAMSVFDVYSNETDENLDRTEKNIAHTKTASGLGGALGGAAAGAAIGSVVPIVGTIIGGIIGGGLGYFLGGEIGETVAEEISSKTDTGNVSGNTTLSDEDKQLLAEAAEEMGAVDIGRGHGDIDSLEKLANLDLASLESLLDMETWKDDDLETIKSIVAAKKEGRAVNYVPEDKGSKWNPLDNVAESLSFGEPGSPSVQGVDVSGAGVITGSTAGAGQDADVDGMSAEEFNALTPDKTTMDDFYKAGTNPGSIYVHDMHVESALNKLLLAAGGSVKITPNSPSTGANIEAIPSEVLQQAVVSTAMIANKQATGGATQMINAPSSIDNSSHQVIAPQSTAHSPAMPSGMGVMGVGSRG